MEFDNTSQEIWEEMQAGTPFSGPKKDEGKYMNNFYGDGNGEFVDFLKLENYLNELFFDEDRTFDYKQFTTDLSQHIAGVMSAPESGQNAQIKGNAEVYYIDKKKKRKGIQFQVRLNKRKGTISPLFTHWITVDPQKMGTSGFLKVYYVDTKSYRRPYDETLDDPDDFIIENKYAAIIIQISNLEEYMVVCNKLLDPYHIEHLEKLILGKFLAYLKKVTSANQLNFLYGAIPDFIMGRLAAELSAPEYKNMLVDHLYILKASDDSNWFSDTSGAMLKLLQLICAIDMSFMYEVFVNHKALVKALYFNMHGQSTFDGQVYPNRYLFAQLLATLCSMNGFEGLRRTGHRYYIGKNYQPDSNVNEANDPNNVDIFLQQFKTVRVKAAWYEIHKFAPYGVYLDDIAITNGEYYDPLDVVLLTDMDSKDKKPNLVPAIFVKYFADVQEWEDIMRYVRIGLDILGIILGVLSLGSSTPLFFALAVADIVLTSTDALVVLNDKMFKQTEQGRKFLEIWDEIMFYGGIATAGPLLIRGVFKQGLKLFRLAENITTKKFIQQSLTAIIKEVNEFHPFIQQPFRFLTETNELIKASSTAFKASFINKLLEVDVTFLGRIDNATQQAKNEFAVVYEGQIIASGDARSIVKQLKKLDKLSGTKLTAKLEEFITFSGRGKYHVKGFLKSEMLTTQEILAWERKFKLLGGVNFRLKSASHNRRVLKYMEDERSLAFFDAKAVPPIVWYRDNPTNYILQHEYYHVEEFFKIGKKEYLKGVDGTIEERFHNTIMREKYVYQKILENKHLFSDAELRHARGNYQYYLKLAIKADVEIISEYIVKID
ncbi:MAG: zincin-like metallopeptidase toxin domain-containing protein [Fluviicola sp.]|nr:zincin-like metallopeptidase toxin domain-containing protein [Fluviicola sp.]